MTYQTFSLPLLNSYSENMILQAEQATQYPILNFSIIASFSLLDYQRLIAKVQVPILNHFGPTIESKKENCNKLSNQNIKLCPYNRLNLFNPLLRILLSSVMWVQLLLR